MATCEPLGHRGRQWRQWRNLFGVPDNVHGLTSKHIVPDVKSLWRPEYGAYMVEGTPGKPYGGLLAHFNVVEANMRYRRAEATSLLNEGEVIMSITNFPR